MVELQGVCKVSLDCALDVHVVAGSTTFALMRTLGISFLFFFLRTILLLMVDSQFSFQHWHKPRHLNVKNTINTLFPSTS